MSRQSAPPPDRGPQTGASQATSDPVGVALNHARSIRSIQDLLKVAGGIVAIAREKLNRRITANIQTPKELFADVEKVCESIAKANKSLQTPKDRLHLNPPLLDDMRAELRQLARLTSRPDIDSRNYHNALVVMASMARLAGVNVTLDAQPDGKIYLIIHAETGQVSFSATGGGAQRLEDCMGMTPGEPTWDGHTSSDRDTRIKAMGAAILRQDEVAKGPMTPPGTIPNGK